MDVESIVEKHTHLQNYSLRTLSLSAGNLERARTVKDRRLEDHAYEVIVKPFSFVVSEYSSDSVVACAVPFSAVAQSPRTVHT